MLSLIEGEYSGLYCSMTCENGLSPFIFRLLTKSIFAGVWEEGRGGDMEFNRYHHTNERALSTESDGFVKLKKHKLEAYREKNIRKHFKPVRGILNLSVEKLADSRCGDRQLAATS